MRVILFRGKRTDNGEWIYGHLAALDMICPEYPEDTSNATGTYYGEIPYAGFVIVDPTTVGQYTELKDKNGKCIFDGDIVHYLYEPGKGYWNADQLSVIDFQGTGFHMNGIMGTNKYACMHGWLISIPYDQDAENKPEFEVVGNIHDNPELLKEADHA